MDAGATSFSTVSLGQMSTEDRKVVDRKDLFLLLRPPKGFTDSPSLDPKEVSEVKKVNSKFLKFKTQNKMPLLTPNHEAQV